jgi:hypothetical protein
VCFFGLGGVSAGPSEITVASVIPKKEESIKTEEPVKTEPLNTSKRQKKRDPEARKKAMARKRKRLKTIDLSPTI